MKLDHCRAKACRAPIIWTITEHGKPMPVDADPLATAKAFRLVDDDPKRPPLAKYVRIADVGERLYVSHHSTCPEASRFRR